MQFLLYKSKLHIINMAAYSNICQTTCIYKDGTVYKLKLTMRDLMDIYSTVYTIVVY